ncbi:MAG: plasmid segregation centromere-binding protein ParR [Mastigocoleus sp.]
MFQWSKKVVKSVTFEPGVADESLLDLVERHLEKQPDKSFSDLCKDALWQSLGVPESVRPAAAPIPVTDVAMGSEQQQIADLKRQMANLEERFFAKESNRLQMMESHIMQLSQQLAQLAIIINQSSGIQASTETVQQIEVVQKATPANSNHAKTSPQDVDPVISRISQFVEDF